MSLTPVSVHEMLPFFDAALLREIEEKASVVHFKPGDVVMRKGQYFKSALIVLKGLIKIYREDEEGNEFFIYYLQPVQACALSMVCASRRETSEIMAIAVADTEALAIPLEAINEWMLKYKSWNEFVVSSYRQRFEDLLSTLDDVVFRNMDERLEFYLKRQAEKIGRHLPLTHQQIATDLNSSREVISRLLKNMEKNKRLVLHRSSIEWLG
jgi:CRP/FNR family transcriptional regulator